jgi:sugar phosphate isomerase/epimerase
MEAHWSEGIDHPPPVRGGYGLKPCLHPSITKSANLTEYLTLAHELGYEMVDAEMSWIDAYADRHGIKAVRDLFSSKNIELASFGLPVDLHADEASFQSDLKEMASRAQVYLTLGATRCCTWLWPSIDERPVPYGSRLARRLRDCANVLSIYGIRLGIEFVGPHHLRDKAYPFVQNLQDLLAFIEAIGSPNVGILLDSYHCYTAPVSQDELLSLAGHQIVHVHVNDTDDPPEKAKDGERLLPGEGVINLLGFLTCLDQIGYTGPLSVEVLHQAPFSELQEVVAERVYQVLANHLQTIREGARDHA